MFWFFFFLGCRDSAPQPGIQPTSPTLEGEVLLTGQPGKSHLPDLYKIKSGCAWGMQMLSGENTVHGILQARILQWVAFAFSWGSSQPRDRVQVSCIAGRFFISWATREAHISVCVCVCVFSWPRGMWGFSSPTRDQTCIPCRLEGEVLTTGPPGKSQTLIFLMH